MDTKNADSILKCDTMAEIRQNNVVVGAKQFKKALRDDRALKAYLAENADPAVTEPIEMMCKEQQIPVIWVRTMKELGLACGIEVGAAAVTAVR
jgi:large subunit ribosomal protein L7A